MEMSSFDAIIPNVVVILDFSTQQCHREGKRGYRVRFTWPLCPLCVPKLLQVTDIGKDRSLRSIPVALKGSSTRAYHYQHCYVFSLIFCVPWTFFFLLALSWTFTHSFNTDTVFIFSCWSHVYVSVLCTHSLPLNIKCGWECHMEFSRGLVCRKTMI